MRLGLVGRGPQAQRYLMPKNGGAHIVSQVPGRIGPAEYQDWLEGVDGVIIATHPAGHRHLALDAIGAGKHVLIEKPLALNLEDCEEILDAAEKAQVAIEVAHTHLWSPWWSPRKWNRDPAEARAVAVYTEHSRDYSAWLDWGPHVLALVADACPRFSAEDLLSNTNVELRVGDRGVFCNVDRRGVLESTYSSTTIVPGPTPMLRMVSRFRSLSTELAPKHRAARRHFNRRVYRALFAGEKTNGS